MPTIADKLVPIKAPWVASAHASEKGPSRAAFQFADRRPEAMAQKEVQMLAMRHVQPQNKELIQRLSTGQTAQSKAIVQRMTMPQGAKLQMQLKADEAMDAESEELIGPDRLESASHHGTTVIQEATHKVKKKPKAKLPASGPKKKTVTVKNDKDNYSSGIIGQTTLPNGVEKGPRAEAQRVASALGGHWVGGHMINDQLGGTGGFNNIIPITSSMNGRHKKIENQANQLLSAGHGTQIEYRMNVSNRRTVKYKNNTVKNLPLVFKQTLNVYPPGGQMYTVTGDTLIETQPGVGTIV